MNSYGHVQLFMFDITVMFLFCFVQGADGRPGNPGAQGEKVRFNL